MRKMKRTCDCDNDCCCCESSDDNAQDDGDDGTMQLDFSGKSELDFDFGNYDDASRCENCLSVSLICATLLVLTSAIVITYNLF